MPRHKTKKEQAKAQFRPNEWWLMDGCDEQELATAIHETVSAIEQRQGLRTSKYQVQAGFYNNNNPEHVFNTAQGKPMQPDEFLDKRMTYNVVKMCVDAITSKIAKSKVRVYYKTSRGDIDQQDQARSMMAFMDHIFESCNVLPKMRESFRDQCVWGTGVVKTSVEHGKIVVDKVRYMDLRIDELEAIDGEPEQMHQVRYVSKAKLKELYKDAHDVIDASEEPETVGLGSINSDRIKVIESWHLKSGPKAKDGWRVVSTTHGVLEEEPYTFTRFPFNFMRWSKPLFGFEGNSLVDELIPIQKQINEVIEQISKAIKFSVPRVFLNSGTVIDESRLNDMIGEIIYYDGALSPVIATASMVSPETFQFLRDLYEKAFECTGISVLSATSKKPGGLESGAAIAEYMDIETERFATTALEFEESIISLGDFIMEVARATFKDDDEIKLSSSDSRYLEKSYWKDIVLPEDSVEVSRYPTNALPKNPAGELQAVITLAEKGIITPEEAKRELNVRDTEDFFRYANADSNSCRRIVSKILKKGVMPEVNRFMPVDLLFKIGKQAYLDALGTDQFEYDHILKLEDFLEQVEAELPGAAPANDNGQPTEEDAQPTGEPMPQEPAA